MKSTQIMNNKLITKLWQSAFAALVAPVALQAGTMEKNPAPVAPAPETPFVTGNLSLFYDTHFISYGQDVWGVGNNWDQWFIHPSIELDFNVAPNLQIYVNTWADVNDQIEGDIGDYVQEIDLNVGVYYTIDKIKLQLGYGAWNYASQTESVVDFKVSYSDGLINPFVAAHGRVDIDLPGYDTGVVGQVGIAPGTTLGPVSISLPITASFDTDGFHAGDGGFAYVSAGIGVSVPLAKHVALSLGATYYHTQDDVIPNVDSDFVTGSAGIVISF